MYFLFNTQSPLVYKLANKQFEIIGVETTFQEIEKIGGVKIIKGGREVIEDYNKHYKFESVEQYEGWRTWAKEELLKTPGAKDDNALREDLEYLDLRYGLNYKI